MLLLYTGSQTDACPFKNSLQVLAKKIRCEMIPQRIFSFFPLYLCQISHFFLQKCRKLWYNNYINGQLTLLDRSMTMSIHKRIPALLLGVILLFAGIPAGRISAQAADTTQQLNNIVLFAQFPDADTDNFMADKTDTAIAICNDTSTPRSLTSYIDAISYGKLHVNSYFPQLSDGVIQPYVLQNSKAEYTNYEQYAIEMVQNIRIPDSIPLDGNQDGMTDNITLVIDGRAESMGDPLWAKAFQVGGLYLGDTPVGSINLMSSYTLLSSTIFSGVGTLCHEFLHSIGYPDLYRKDSSSGNPVGQWDLMATNSIFLQYPLAYQRYAVSGWLDAKTITTAGTYTLQPASSSTGDRLYLLKTPFQTRNFLRWNTVFPESSTPKNWTARSTARAW